mgnify:CR=1 FL=1
MHVAEALVLLASGVPILCLLAALDKPLELRKPPGERFAVLNLFFGMQVKNFRVFLKMTHFSQFDKFDGYFVTPYYPAQKKVLDLGVKWYFFN